MKKLIIVPMLTLALAMTAAAQTTTTGPGTMTRLHELALGGSGASDTDFDDSYGGINVSYGMYFNETLLGSIRQSVNYANPDIGGTAWNGSTRFGLVVYSVLD